jgi:hypothetical protein
MTGTVPQTGLGRVVEMLSPPGWKPISKSWRRSWPSTHPPEYYDLAHNYGITIQHDWVEDLEQTYGVKL